MSVNTGNLKRRALEELKLDTEDLTCAVCLGKKTIRNSLIEISKKGSRRTVPLIVKRLYEFFRTVWITYKIHKMRAWFLRKMFDGCQRKWESMVVSAMPENPQMLDQHSLSKFFGRKICRKIQKASNDQIEQFIWDVWKT